MGYPINLEDLALARYLPTKGSSMARRLQLALLTSVLLVALACTFERQAHAYVDPGSSLLLFQSLSALVSGALFYFRRRIKSLFTRTSPKSADPINTPLAGPR
jgi:hypothetical protein